MIRARQPISKRILIADDDPASRGLLDSAVTSEGYIAVVVKDGSAAYKILQSDADFTAALFDMNMPGLNGIELIRHMSTEKRLQRIPVMLMTADRGLRGIANSLAAGAVAFLPKPLTAHKLQNALRILLRSAQIKIVA